MMEIPVLVSIHSTARREDGSEEPVSLLTSGALLLEDERARIIYEETLDEDMPPQPVTVTVEDDMLMMQRDGDYATQLIFRRGQRYEGIYRTPFGEMDVAVFCTRLSYDLNEDGGEIVLMYQMDMNGTFAAMHQMHMQVMVKNG
ncbi:MAG: DUF1934 domain-containing protein [Clostridiales bacterium]|nr:DUF1934 domain-containing protein [Clostridiales bacterium]